MERRAPSGFAGLPGLAALGAFFYYRYQNEQPLEKKKRRRILLTVFRSGLLAIVGFILAEPIVSVSLTEHPRPILLMLFDGSDSMNLVDELSTEQADALDAMTPDVSTLPSKRDWSFSITLSKTVHYPKQLGNCMRSLMYAITPR